jgi:hypothetical protein
MCSLEKNRQNENSTAQICPKLVEEKINYFFPNLTESEKTSHFSGVVKCLTVHVDSHDITAQVSGEQKHYFHLLGLQKSF